jgi:hypothetical protein
MLLLFVGAIESSRLLVRTNNPCIVPHVGHLFMPRWFVMKHPSSAPIEPTTKKAAKPWAPV